jgi:hypothetical protein
MGDLALGNDMVRGASKPLLVEPEDIRRVRLRSLIKRVECGKRKKMVRDLP